MPREAKNKVKVSSVNSFSAAATGAHITSLQQGGGHGAQKPPPAEVLNPAVH